MSSWIPLLVRAEDFGEFAAMVATREADRADDDNATVVWSALSSPIEVDEPHDLMAPPPPAPSWPEGLLRRLGAGTALTAQRWARALDVVAASDDQTWFTTSEIALRTGMTINEWRDACRKLPRHLKANYPDAPRNADGQTVWPLRDRNITPAEVSWAMTSDTKATWRRIRGL